MSMLITPAEVEALTGEPVPEGTSAARVEALAQYLLALAELEARRRFRPGPVSWTLKVDSGLVVLPQAVEVKAVCRADSPSMGAINVRWRPANPLSRSATTSQIIVAGCTNAQLVAVLAEIPESVLSALVKTRIALMVLRVLRTNPGAVTGLSSRLEVNGPFTTQESYAEWARAGAPDLTDQDRQFFRGLRSPRSGHTWVQIP